MGGSALLIYGTVAERLLQPRPGPRSILDRVLGRSRMVTPEWEQLGRTRRMMSLPTNGLTSLAREFRNHVAMHLQPPWAATATVLNYLALDVIEIHLRGEQDGDKPPEWYVQIGFSGCGGMAEVSSELAAHWAERWFRSERERIASTFLRPHGFEPDGRTEPAGSAVAFVPIGTAGYAIFSPTPREVDPEEEFAESQYFDLDASALEMVSESERAEGIRKLDTALQPLIPRQPCCCQWCAPMLDVVPFDRAVPFN